MKDSFKLVFTFSMFAALIFGGGYKVGQREAMSRIPSCLYINRPRQNDIKPLGYDGRVGVDWYFDRIAGGGLYISLRAFKESLPWEEKRIDQATK